VNVFLATAAVFAGFGIMAMAGLGAATLFIPIFYYAGTPLPEAITVGLLLNVVALGVAVPGYLRVRTVNLRLGMPILVLATALAPLGAWVSHSVNRDLLLGVLAGFLAISGTLMLFDRRQKLARTMPKSIEIGVGAGVGGGVGFLAGLLGVGGGAFVLPVLHGIGLAPRIAVGTTALVALASSVAGFVARAALGSIDVGFASATAMAAGAGALLGSHIAITRLSSRGLEMAVAVTLWLIAIKMGWDLAS
jgi:uncharacterized membrane protein YfcA